MIAPGMVALSCSICGDPSTSICVYCTKDACTNHRCDRCKRCSDCCECDVPLSAAEIPVEPVAVDPIAVEPIAVEPLPEPAAETPEPLPEPLTAPHPEAEAVEYPFAPEDPPREKFMP